MTRIAANALLYWAVVFAVGFLLGTVRTLWLAPRVGPVAAVLVELPLMLAPAWFAARAILARWPLAGSEGALAMGGIAFAVLMAAELGLAAAFGIAPGAWLASLGEPPGLLGLAGQLGFALLPWWLCSQSDPAEPRLP
jgi:hypothetical protein